VNRQRFLKVLGVAPAAWTARYGVEPFEHECQQCSEPLRTTIPFACGDYRGLMAPACPSCGNQRTPFAIVKDPRHGDLFAAIDRGDP
jgi:hypothetical protein